MKIIGYNLLAKKIIILLSLVLIILGVIMLSSKLSPSKDAKLLVFIDDTINKNDLKIIINPHGNILKGYEPISFIGRNYKYFLLYDYGGIQMQNLKEINKYSDYYIYAKYNNKYAKMKYTNSLVLGDDKTVINIHVKEINNIFYLSSTKELPITIESIDENSFKNIREFDQDKYDKKLLEYLSKF